METQGVVSVSRSRGTGFDLTKVINEPRREKTGLRGFRPCPTQTGL